MIIYVNGDSHSAAAEALVPYSWAQDDELYYGLGKRPHPDNEKVSYGCELANSLGSILQCDAQSGSSNTRIIRTTRQWLDYNKDNLKDVFVILQWSTWEREEWWHQGQDYQVNASGIDHVPTELSEKYKQFISDINWKQAEQSWHTKIWDFHCELKNAGIRHLMFNGNSYFQHCQNQQPWDHSYFYPYDSEKTFHSVLKNHGFKTINDQSWHFGPDAHCFWANYLLQYINDNQLLV